MGPMNYSCCLVFVFLYAACMWSISAHPRDQIGGNAYVTKVHVASTTKGYDVDEVVVSPPALARKDERIGGRKMAAMSLEKDVNKVGVDNVQYCKQSSGGCFSGKATADDDDSAGFVAFINQDYHPPRHHPPKNN